jgi:hypothetical protein
LATTHETDPRTGPAGATLRDSGYRGHPVVTATEAEQTVDLDDLVTPVIQYRSG